MLLQACNELVHSKVVTVADRQEALNFNMAHLLVHVKTGFNVKCFLTLWSYCCSSHVPLGQHMVHGNTVQVENLITESSLGCDE